MSKNETKKINADILVMGAGGSGLVAALTAAEQGARVMVCEKRSVVGGTSNFPSGPFAAESKMQRQKWMSVTCDEVFKIMMEYSHWRADPRLVRTIVNESAQTIDWLQGKGVVFDDVMAMTPGGLPTWHLLEGHGAPMVKALLEKAKEKDVEFYLSHSLKEIIKQKEKITGAIIKDKSDQSISIKSKAVIIASGGYANNKKWIKKYTGLDLGKDLFPHSDLKLTGDGIQKAWNAGAAREGMGVLMLQYGVPGPGVMGTRLTAIARQPYLWINQDGRRFSDEGITANWPFAGNAIARQKNRYAYLMFDENTKKYMEERGFDIGAGPVLPTSRPDNVQALFKNAVAKGNENIFVARSLKAIADKTGIHVNTLIATINEYNSYCAKNHDDLFNKDPKYLQSFKEAPFYVMRIFLRFLGTLGGIKINEKTEVLSNDQNIIPGLYAAGNDAGGMYVGSYDLWIPGGALGFALNSGRIAGKSAAEYCLG
ncbi:MAG: FAD-dependent oxidoreductase [Deltaproteobacteria bacterium]|nr:FAD-dependent oxidoreductase [Deltaproteobacteria bacterium]